MVVAFDTNVLLLLLDESVDPPKMKDAEGNIVEIPRARDRVEYLFKRLSDRKAEIIIPTPVISEVLAGSGDAFEQWRQFLEKLARIRIKPFCYRSAVELAVTTDGSNDNGESRNKVKVDRQIVTIAKVNGAGVLYTRDQSMQNYARRNDIEVYGVEDLDEPPEDPQQRLELPQSGRSDNTSVGSKTSTSGD